METTDLDQIKLDENVGSHEQMSVDQVFDLRLQFALGQSAALFSQVQFADAKAGTLLALVGVLAAHVAAGGVTSVPTATAVLLLMNAVVLGICIAVLTPRIGKEDVRRNLARSDRFSWPALTGDVYGAEDHASFLRRSQASQLVISVGRSNVAVAKILFTKYRLLQLAFLATLVDVATTLLIAAIAGAPPGKT